MHHNTPFTPAPAAFALAVLLPILVLGALPVPAQAQSQIYRCGTEYTNSPTPEQKKSCNPLDSGNVTVIPATKVKGNGGGSKPAVAAPAASDQAKVDPSVQKTRDSDARAILDAEQRRAERRLTELQHEYNAGQPERRGEEVRNQQRYSERVAALKDSLARAEADLAGIRRELLRAGGGTASASPGTASPR